MLHKVISEFFQYILLNVSFAERPQVYLCELCVAYVSRKHGLRGREPSVVRVLNSRLHTTPALYFVCDRYFYHLSSPLLFLIFFITSLRYVPVELLLMLAVLLSVGLFVPCVLQVVQETAVKLLHHDQYEC